MRSSVKFLLCSLKVLALKLALVILLGATSLESWVKFNKIFTRAWSHVVWTYYYTFVHSLLLYTRSYFTSTYVFKFTTTYLFIACYHGYLSNLHERTKLHEAIKLHEGTKFTKILLHEDTFVRGNKISRRWNCTKTLMHEEKILHEDTFARAENFARVELYFFFLFYYILLSLLPLTLILGRKVFYY